MKKFIVKRSEWSRGIMSPKINALLVPPNSFFAGKKCCLGFCTEQCGVPADLMNGVAYPSDLLFDGEVPEEFRLFERNRNFHELASSINDSKDISEEEREARLIELFARHYYELEFID